MRFSPAPRRLKFTRANPTAVLVVFVVIVGVAACTVDANRARQRRADCFNPESFRSGLALVSRDSSEFNTAKPASTTTLLAATDASIFPAAARTARPSARELQLSDASPCTAGLLANIPSYAGPIPRTPSSERVKTRAAFHREFWQPRKLT